MNHTKMTIKGDKFYINGELTYSEIDGCPYRGLLMNARFIQGFTMIRPGGNDTAVSEKALIRIRTQTN